MPPDRSLRFGAVSLRKHVGDAQRKERRGRLAKGGTLEARRPRTSLVPAAQPSVWSAAGSAKHARTSRPRDCDLDPAGPTEVLGTIGGRFTAELTDRQPPDELATLIAAGFRNVRCCERLRRRTENEEQESGHHGGRRPPPNPG